MQVDCNCLAAPNSDLPVLQYHYYANSYCETATSHDFTTNMTKKTKGLFGN